ncbi:MAG: hypothetical protein J6Q52_00520 [Clostridia bacterium]|nr:hypothetical protein [Clostridia bacterium]
MKSIKTASESVILDYTYTKTLLYCYRYLGKYYRALNEDLRERVKFDYDVKHHISTDKLLATTIQLNHRLAGIVNMKVLVDKGLAHIPHIYSKVLILKYFKAMDSNTIAKSLQISIRTYYRRYATAIKLIQKYFDSVGYDATRIQTEYAEETLFQKMLRLVTSGYHHSS